MSPTPLPLRDPSPGQFGHGGDHALPSSLRGDFVINGVVNTDIADQNLLRDTFNLQVDKSTGAVTCTFDVLQRGGGLDLSSLEAEVHVYDVNVTPGTAYTRWASLISTGAASTSQEGDKLWHMRLGGKAEVILAKPPKQLTGQWPPGDGTTVVDTTSLDAITTFGTPVTFHVANPANIQVGKYYYAQEAGSPAGGVKSERVLVAALGTSATGTTVTATFQLLHGAGFLFGSGLTSAEVLGTGWYAQDPTAHNVALGIAAGSRTVSPVDYLGSPFMTGIFKGDSGSQDCYVYCCNANDTNAEMVKVTAVPTSSSFTAVFSLSKSAHWKCYPMLWQYGFYDEFLNNSSAAKISTSIAAGPRTISLGSASMNNVYVNRLLWVENADGSNRERVMVTGVNVGLSQFTATFLYSKTNSGGGWIVYQGVPCLTNGIDEVQTSLPHLSWPAGTELIDIPKQIAENLPLAPNVVTTSSQTVSAGTYVSVAVADATGLQIGDVLRVYNDDLSNSERVQVSNISGNSVTMGFAFSHARTGSPLTDWHLVGVQFPQIYYTFPSDTGANVAGWEIQPIYRDTADTNTRCLVEFTDAIVVNVDTQAHYEDYLRDVDGTQRITHQDVVSSDGTVAGSYTDVAAERAIGRRKSGSLIIRDNLVSVAEADDIALRQVRNFGRLRDTFQGVVTKQLVDQYLMHDIKVIRIGHTYEGGTPEYLPITHYSLSFPEGVASHRFDLGDAIPSQGDKAVPLFGTGSVIDRRGPNQPTWAANGGWQLSNVYLPETDRVAIHIACIETGLDIGYMLFEANDGRGWQRQRLDWPTLDCTFTDLLPDGVSVQFRVTAFDRAQPPNPGPPSPIVTATTVNHTLADPPDLDDAHVTQDYYEDGFARMVRVGVPVTPSTSVQVSATHWFVTIADFGTDRFIRPGYGTFESFVLPAGKGFTIYAVAVQWGREGGSSNVISGATIGTAIDELMNGGFESGYGGGGFATGWTYTEDITTLIKRTDTPVAPQSGLWYMRITRNTLYSPAYVTSSTIQVDSTRTYMLSVWLRGSASTPNCKIEVLYYDIDSVNIATHTYDKPTSSSQWLHYTFSEIPPGLNANFIRIRFTNAHGVNGDCYIDNVTWVKQANNDEVQYGTLEPDRLKFYTAQDVLNPNFAIKLADGSFYGWTISPIGGASAQQDTTQAVEGPTSLVLGSGLVGGTVAGYTHRITVSSAIGRRFRLLYKSTLGTGTLYVRIKWFNLAGSNFSTSDMTAAGYVPSSGAIKKIEIRMTPPVNAIQAEVHFLYTASNITDALYMGGVYMSEVVTGAQLSSQLAYDGSFQLVDNTGTLLSSVQADPGSGSGTLYYQRSEMVTGVTTRIVSTLAAMGGGAYRNFVDLLSGVMMRIRGFDFWGNYVGVDIAGHSSEGRNNGRTGDIKFWAASTDPAVWSEIPFVGPQPASTSETHNFLFLGGVAGQPTGTPQDLAGTIAIVPDTVNEFIYLYMNGAWRGVKLAPAGKTRAATFDRAGHTVYDRSGSTVWGYEDI